MVEYNNIFKPSTIVTRYNFGSLLNEMGLVGAGAEIGVHRGRFSYDFLRSWNGERLYLVDPWDEHLEEYAKHVSVLPNHDMYEQGSVSRILDFLRAVELTNFAKDRVLYLKTTSEKALHLIRENLDFVYLDGNHDREYFEFDLNEWWKRVNPGGVLAGHDLACPVDPDFSLGVVIEDVLTSFCSERNLVVHCVCDDLEPWSWYIVKD